MAWSRRLDANVSLQLTSTRFNFEYLSELLGYVLELATWKC
jgi:hypothetical protein